MAGYTFLKEGYQLIETTNSITGTKVFLEIDGGSDDLPIIGDSFDEDHEFIVCNKITKTIYHVNTADVCSNGYKYVCNYSNAVGWYSSINVPIDDEDQRTFSVGGEIMSIDGSSSTWKWADDVGELGTDNVENQKLFMSNPVGLITKSTTIPEANLGTFKTLLLSTAGRINSAAFEGFGKGTVLFLGAQGNLRVEEDGTRVWVFILSFKYRILAGKTEDTWQYIWRKDATGSRWSIPAMGSTEFEDNLYDYASFASL